MKIHKITFYALALLSFASCNNDDIVPDTPDVPTEGYHLTFDGGVGVETGTNGITPKIPGRMRWSWRS